LPLAALSASPKDYRRLLASLQGEFRRNHPMPASFPIRPKHHRSLPQRPNSGRKPSITQTFDLMHSHLEVSQILQSSPLPKKNRVKRGPGRGRYPHPDRRRCPSGYYSAVQALGRIPMPIHCSWSTLRPCHWQVEQRERSKQAAIMAHLRGGAVVTFLVTLLPI
jgi:hypothetical protein